MSCILTERLTRYMEQVGKDDFFPIIIRWKNGEFSRDLATKGKVNALAASPGIRSIGLEEIQRPANELINHLRNPISCRNV